MWNQQGHWNMTAEHSLNSIYIIFFKNLIVWFILSQNVLREEIKDKFKYDVDRTTPSNKIRDFMDWASDIIRDIKYQRKIRSNIVGRMLLKLWWLLLKLLLKSTQHPTFHQKWKNINLDTILIS